MLALKRFIVVYWILLWMNWRFIMFVVTRIHGFLGWSKMMITEFLVKFNRWKCIIAEWTWLMSLMGWDIQRFWGLLLRLVFFPTHWFCYDVLNNYFVRYRLRRNIMRKLASKRFWNILIDHWSWCWKFEVFIKLGNFSFWRMRFFCD